MLTKYASFEVSDILEIKGTSYRQVTASLDKVGDYADYRTSDGYMYVRLRAISSRVNKNHDGWPSIELAGSPEIFERHHSGGGFTVAASEGGDRGFATFMGKPFFVDHHNSNPRKARGVIVDSKFSVLDHKTAALGDDYWGGHNVDPEHLPPSEVELLIEIDAREFPKIAKDIRDGRLDGFSMGCDVEYSKCSHCGHIAHNPDEFCSHIMMKGAQHDYKTADGQRTSRKSYENCYGITFFEISGVFDPADETALAREVKAGVAGAPDNADLFAEQTPFRGRMACPECRGIGCGACGGKGYAHVPVAFGEGTNTPASAETMIDRGGPGTVGPYENYQGIRNQGSTHTAENPLPQEFMTRAPEEIDTLRDEKICPVCSAEMTGETCDVCGYVQPPQGFDNPDLTQAIKMRDQMKQQEEGQDMGLNQPEQPPQPGGPLTGQPTGAPQMQAPQHPPTKTPAFAGTISDMTWTPNVHPHTAGRINPVEKPISNSQRPATDEPVGVIVKSDQTKPVTSAMLTAQRLMANAQRKHQGDSMSTRTADGATAPEAGASQRVDVTGVGGVMDASNEQASKAQAQIDVTGIGGTGVEGVDQATSESLPTAGQDGNDSGFNTDRTTDDSGPTKTFGDSDGSHSGITDPVTSEPFPASEDGVKKGRIGFDESQGDMLQDSFGGSANQGTQPVDPVGKAGDRVDVLKAVTSPSNNSGPTDTWSGTDGNSIYRQQDPVTQDKMEWGGIPVPDVQLHTKAHMISAMRLADAELELGLIHADQKYNRIAQLEGTHPAVIGARLQALAEVKTAGLAKLASSRTGAHRLPSAFGKETAAPNGFQRIASDTPPAQATSITEAEMDSLLFTR